MHYVRFAHYPHLASIVADASVGLIWQYQYASADDNLAKKAHMDVISFAGRAIDTLKAIDSKCTRLEPLAFARNARCGHRSFLAKAILTMSLGALLSSCGGGGSGGGGP